MEREEFEKRMENWRRTVRGGSGGGGHCCASWAEMYIKARSKDGNGNDVAPPRMIVTVNELDGWLIEAAVNTLIIFNERMALRYWHVFKYPEHWIKTKLLMRATGVRIVLARAETNLQKVLDKLGDPAKILSNNLHAGIDPRPESIDARRASLTLEKEKALSESSFGAFCIERNPDTFKSFPSIFSDEDENEKVADLITPPQGI